MCCCSPNNSGWRLETTIRSTKYSQNMVFALFCRRSWQNSILNNIKLFCVVLRAGTSPILRILEWKSNYGSSITSNLFLTNNLTQLKIISTIHQANFVQLSWIWTVNLFANNTTFTFVSYREAIKSNLKLLGSHMSLFSL